MHASNPCRVLTEDTFSSISEYIITKKFLVGKVVSVVVDNMRVLGCPVRLEGKAYARNALMFNVGFVLSTTAGWRPYKAVLSKLASVLASMEREDAFLRNDAPQYSALRLLLNETHVGLCQRGECVVPVLAGHTLALKLFPVLPAPPVVGDHDVPVRVKDLDALAGEDWDLCLRRIIPRIDGVSHVSAIARGADVELHLARRAIEHLVYYGFVALVDAFQYSNVYAITEKAQTLLNPESAALAAEAVVYAAAHKAAVAPTPEDVFRVLAAFGTSMRVCDVVVSCDSAALGLDDRALVVFAVLHGLLRRMHAYPVPLTVAAADCVGAGVPASSLAVTAAQTPPSTTTAEYAAAGSSAEFSSPGQSEKKSGDVDARVLVGGVQGGGAAEEAGLRDMLSPELWKHRKLLDGSHCMDEVCCAAGMSFTDASAELTGAGHFMMVLR